MSSNVRSMAGRRLAVALERVPTETVTRWDWDSADGEAFVREVMAVAATDVAVAELGEELGIPNLVAVVAARRRYLT